MRDDKTVLTIFLKTHIISLKKYKKNNNNILIINKSKVLPHIWP
jgi:hypothetical protein